MMISLPESEYQAAKINVAGWPACQRKAKRDTGAGETLSGGGVRALREVSVDGRRWGGKRGEGKIGISPHRRIGGVTR